MAEIGDDLLVTELPCKKRGRPHLLKESVDAEVQASIRSMRDGGAVVNTSITIAVATGVVRKRDRFSLKENGGSLELTKSQISPPQDGFCEEERQHQVQGFNRVL